MHRGVSAWQSHWLLKHLTGGVAAAIVGAIVVGCSLLTALVVRLTTPDGVDDVVRDNKTTLKMAQVCRKTNAWVAAIFFVFARK